MPGVDPFGVTEGAGEDAAGGVLVPAAPSASIILICLQIYISSLFLPCLFSSVPRELDRNFAKWRDSVLSQLRSCGCLTPMSGSKEHRWSSNTPTACLYRILFIWLRNSADGCVAVGFASKSISYFTDSISWQRTGQNQIQVIVCRSLFVST